MVIIKYKTMNNKCWVKCGEKGNLGGDAHWYSRCGRQDMGPAKQLKLEL